MSYERDKVGKTAYLESEQSGVAPAALELRDRKSVQRSLTRQTGAKTVVTRQASGHQNAVEPVNNEINRLVGWASLVLGAGSGLIVGLWSFDGPVPAPGSLENYVDLSRRFIRLGHIAFFGLGILNILLAREVSGLAVGGKAKRAALRAMNFGNVALPLTLLAAAVYHPLKYLLPISALSVFAALSVAAYGVWRGREKLR